jgi:hypothetical protein
MKTLDFMIAGVQKGGTTALSYFLSQHPQLAIAQGKEVHLFDAPDYLPTWDSEQINQRYAAHFSDASMQQLWGEATPIYCYWPEIAAELRRYNPALKLIVILRDPVERAISQYAMEKARGDESLPLWLALCLEPYRLWRDTGRQQGGARRCHSYCSRGHYNHQLENLRRYFPVEQILVLENSELNNQHQATLQKICAFLGVAADQLPEPASIFSGDYDRRRHQWLRWLLGCYFRLANRRLKSQLIAMGYSPQWTWLR